MTTATQDEVKLLADGALADMLGVSVRTIDAWPKSQTFRDPSRSAAAGDGHGTRCWRICGANPRLSVWPPVRGR